MALEPSSSRPPGRQPSIALSSAQLGTLIVLISLSVLFGASLVAFLITRSQNDVWRTHDMPPLPSGLLLSTAAIVAIWGSLRWALRSVRSNRYDSLTRALYATLGCALLFLTLQALNWRSMATTPVSGEARTLYQFTFYMLTALHAIHVVAGFVPLGVVTAKAQRREYSSSRYEGVKLCAQYWDFLGVVWFVLLCVIYLAT